MPANDIIDNRDQKLADHINCILGSTEAAAIPYDIYMKTLYALAVERLDEGGKGVRP